MSFCVRLFARHLLSSVDLLSFQSKNPFDVNVAASRLILDILPGLEVSVLSETDGLVARLYDWMESAREPLMCYATGLLAVAMELSDVATDPENRYGGVRFTVCSSVLIVSFSEPKTLVSSR